MEFQIRNSKITLEVNKFEPKFSDKEHYQVGWVNISINDIAKIKQIKLMERKEDKSYWLALPSVLNKGKYDNVVFISKEDKELIALKIKNGNNQPEEDEMDGIRSLMGEEQANQLPWEEDTPTNSNIELDF